MIVEWETTAVRQARVDAGMGTYRRGRTADGIEVIEFGDGGHGYTAESPFDPEREVAAEDRRRFEVMVTRPAYGMAELHIADGDLHLAQNMSVPDMRRLVSLLVMAIETVESEADDATT